MVDVWVGDVRVLSGRTFPAHYNVGNALNDALLPFTGEHSEEDSFFYVFSDATGKLRRDITFRELDSNSLDATLYKGPTLFQVHDACVRITDGLRLSDLSLFLRSDARIAGHAVRLRSENLGAVDFSLLNDANFMKSLLGFVPTVMLAQYASVRLKASEDFAYTLLRRDCMAFKYLRVDAQEALAVQPTIYGLLSSALRRRLAEEAINANKSNAKHVPAECWTRKTFVMKVLRQHPSLYHYAPKKLVDQPGIAALAMQANVYVFSSLPRHLKTNRKFVCRLIRRNIPLLELGTLTVMLPMAMRDDLRVARALLRRDFTLRQFLSRRIRHMRFKL